MPKAVAMLLFAGLAFSAYLWKRVHPSVGVFFGYVVGNAVFTGFAHSFQMLECIYIGAALGLGSLSANMERHEMRLVLLAVMWGALLNAAMGYVQMTGNDFLFIYRTPEHMRTPTGFLGQQTLLGPFLATGAVAALFFRKWWAAIFILPVLATVGSSFTYFAFAVGLGVYALHALPLRHMLKSIAGAVLVVSHFVYQGGEWLNDQGRFEMWRRIAETTFKEAPIFGRGFGTYMHYAGEMQSRLSMEMNGFYREAHNDFVQLFHDGGIFGVFLVLVMGFFFLKKAYENFFVPEVAASTACALIILANSFGNFILRLTPQGLIPVVCAIMVITFRRKEAFDDL